MTTPIEDWQVPEFFPPEASPPTDIPADGQPPSATSGHLPVCSARRGLVIVLFMIVAADVCVYRATGFTGPAVFLATAGVLLACGIPQRSMRPAVLAVAAMLIITILRLTMNGSIALLVTGTILLTAVLYAMRGRPPFLLETLQFAMRSLPAGFTFLQATDTRFRRSVLEPIDKGHPHKWLGRTLPLASALVFGFIFLMANPRLARAVSTWLGDVVEKFQQWFSNFSIMEVLFWAAVAWLTAGLLRPLAIWNPPATSSRASSANTMSAMYEPFRRTLLTLIGLFAAYLVFEFYTLSTNIYERGFGFSDYAHEGAMWLTVALILATLMLSLIFRGAIFDERRLPTLRRLAWLWIMLNLVLAVAVYTRLLIYIDYNGMTRMRTIGLLGVSSVVAGFAVVCFKIAWEQNFYWLVQRQLGILGLAAYLYVSLPVDLLCCRHNVSRILQGDMAPAVQLAVHSFDMEATPEVLPLLQHEQESIRRGAYALILQQRAAALRKQSNHWTAWQYSTESALARLNAAIPPSDIPSADESTTEKELSEFRAAVMQWY